MQVKIESFHSYGNQRIEVKLSNGQSLTLMVDSDTGKLQVLSDAPHVIGGQALNDKGLPCNVIPVEYYGYPSD